MKKRTFISILFCSVALLTLLIHGMIPHHHHSHLVDTHHFSHAHCHHSTHIGHTHGSDESQCHLNDFWLQGKNRSNILVAALFVKKFLNLILVEQVTHETAYYNRPYLSPPEGCILLRGPPSNFI